MANTTAQKSLHRAGAIPNRGTLPIAANTLLYKGTMVQQDANGRAVSPATADASALPCAGISTSTYDNRTNAEMGGLDDSGDAELEYGVFGFAISGTVPKARDLLYVVDNQTVSMSSNGGTRGFAGVCSEVRTDEDTVQRAYFMVNPLLGRAVLAAAAASVTQFDVMSAYLATGAPIAVFANGASAVPGTDVEDSEIAGIRWNNNATLNAIQKTVYLPGPSDPAAKATLHLVVSKVGATLADATTFTVGGFAVAVGQTHDAGSDIGGTTTACLGSAATKTLQEVTLDLTGANLPDTACQLTLTIKPTDGTLGTDDMCLHSAFITR
jgi:hypothetical protein